MLVRTNALPTYEFSEQYRGLSKIHERWPRSQGHIDGYEFHAPNGVSLSVWTTEQEYVEETGHVEPRSYDPDRSRFFVLPPGKWVDTIDEVLEIWDRYD